jgi:hypothetical protein
MKNIRFLIPVLLLSCSTNQNSKTAADTSIQTATTKTDSIVAPVSQPGNTQQGNAIELVFAKDSSSASAEGYIDTAGASVHCYFSISRPGKLSASITVAKPAANIRFSQIILPNGKSDGPFGRQLEYRLTQRGRYQLKIGPSLMADDAYVGDFVVKVKVE